MNKVLSTLTFLVGITAPLFTSCDEHTSAIRSNKLLTLDSVVYNQLFTLGLNQAEQKLEVNVKYTYPINDSILSKGFATSFFPKDLVANLYEKPDSLIERYSHRLFEDFQSDAIQEVPEGTPIFGHNWILDVENRILYQDSYIASAQVRQYTFTGGAHGFESFTNMSIDRSTGHIINEADLFIEDYQSELAKIIVERLKAQYNASSIDELGEYGFFDTSEITPNNNFYLTDTEMVYIFNTYEIAPYAIGIVSVKIPFDLIGQLIRSGSLLEHYV